MSTFICIEHLLGALLMPWLKGLQGAAVPHFVYVECTFGHIYYTIPINNFSQGFLARQLQLQLQCQLLLSGPTADRNHTRRTHGHRDVAPHVGNDFLYGIYNDIVSSSSFCRWTRPKENQGKSRGILYLRVFSNNSKGRKMGSEAGDTLTDI